MRLKLRHSALINRSEITITGSKSESNRLLLLQALYPEIEIQNVSNSDDSRLMQSALQNTSDLIDIHHAGTAMRFLTAYFSIQDAREVILTGSERMQQRPIQILVDALRQLGADITYLDNEGFPPLKIKGNNLKESKVAIKANVSSQYISALILIGSKLEQGITVKLEGEITSIPYIKMTLDLLDQIDVDTSFVEDTITVKPKVSTTKEKHLVVESDWSSASYYYSCVALSPIGTKITLSAYKQDSLQGDAVLVDVYSAFGVATQFIDNTIILSKTSSNLEPKQCHLIHAPDLAQTIAVTCLGLNIPCELTGLHTLKIKETDRLIALKTEIEKFGTEVAITDNALSFPKSKTLNKNVMVSTYKDHRMAMAFAPLGLKTDLIIDDANVVSKSYPDFWKDLSKIGFNLIEL